MKKSSIIIVISLAGFVASVRLADFMSNANTAGALGVVAIFGVFYGVILKCNSCE